MTPGSPEQIPGKQPWPLVAKIAAPLVALLIVAGLVAVMQPTPSDHDNSLRTVGTSATTAAKAPRTTQPPTSRPRPTAPPSTQSSPTAPPPTAAISVPPVTAPGTRKNCSAFTSRIDAEIWVQYATGVGLDTSGIARGPNGEDCPSLPGPDL